MQIEQRSTDRNSLNFLRIAVPVMLFLFVMESGALKEAVVQIYSSGCAEACQSSRLLILRSIKHFRWIGLAFSLCLMALTLIRIWKGNRSLLEWFILVLNTAALLASFVFTA